MATQQAERLAASAPDHSVTQSRPVTPAVFQGDLRSLPTSLPWQPGKPTRIISLRGRPVTPAPAASELVAPASEPEAAAGPSSSSQQNLLAGFVNPVVNVDGLAFTGVWPPDTVGDVGPDHYIQMVNGPNGAAFAIYDKSANLLVHMTSLSLLWSAASACRDNPLGDPIVLYDSQADRWFMAEITDPLIANSVCIYISQTPDPITGGWFLYEFALPSFPDYPKYGVWPDAYYLSTNEVDPIFFTPSPAVYALDRNNMLNGLPATFQRFTVAPLAGFGFQALIPADIDGATPPPAGAAGIFMRHRDDELHGGVAATGAGLIDGSGAWQSIDVDIGAALGSASVVLQFSFETLDLVGNFFEGFHIDDITVTADGGSVFDDDLETGAPGWNGTGLWHLTTDCSATQGGHSPPTSFYFGQDVVCNYDDFLTTSGTLTSPAIDLSGFSTEATLSFNYFLQTEQFCPFDDVRVRLSIDGGLSFVDIAGNCLSIALPPADPTQDFLELWEFSVDFSDPANSSLNGPLAIPVAEFDSDLCGPLLFDCIPQPNGQNLDALREVLMWRLQYRHLDSHETLVGNFTVDADTSGQAGIRWFELQRSAAGWDLAQEGTQMSDDAHRWMASIAMDGNGNIALGYSVASSGLFPSIRYSGRFAGDPPGEMTQGEHTLFAGSGSQGFGIARWGDYSSMNVDPVDDCTFWYTSAYLPADGFWQTRIGALRLPGCEPPPPPPAQSGLYGSSVFGELFRIDLSNGAGTLTGTLDDVCFSGGTTEIEYDNLLQIAYAQGRDGSFCGWQFDIRDASTSGGAVFTFGAFNALESVDGVWYGTLIYQPGGFSELHILDPLSGVSEFVGVTGVGPISGLAYDETTATLYGIAGGPGPAGLYTIDLSTGLAAFTGSTGIQAGSLQFGPDKQLYAGGTGPDAGNLFIIDRNTAAATLVGATGFGPVTGLTLLTGTVGASTDLAISKTDNTTSVNAGGLLIYEIVVSNNGPESAADVAISDLFPAQLDNIIWTATGSGGAAGFTGSGNGDITESGIMLPPGAGITYTVAATVAIAALPGTVIVNTATVTGGSDPDPANNSATDADTTVTSPLPISVADLAITKTDNTTSVSAGAGLTYTIVVSNNGPGEATDIAILDLFPAQLINVSWTAQGSGGASGFDASGSALIAETGITLPVGAGIIYTAAATVAADTLVNTTLDNTAAVLGPVIDLDLSNNSATDDDTLVVVSPVIADPLFSDQFEE